MGGIDFVERRCASRYISEVGVSWDLFLSSGMMVTSGTDVSLSLLYVSPVLICMQSTFRMCFAELRVASYSEVTRLELQHSQVHLGGDSASC
jgi:hypothetical protein